MKPATLLSLFLSLFPSLCALTGCLSSGGAEEEPSLRDVTVTTRMEFIENHGNRDSLVDVHFELRTSRTRIGSRYSTRIDFATPERGFIQGYEDDSFATDTLMLLSWTFTQEIAKLKGQTIQAAVSINGNTFARDSVTYY